MTSSMRLALLVSCALLALVSFLLAKRTHRQEVQAGRPGRSRTVRVVLILPLVMALLVIAIELFL